MKRRIVLLVMSVPLFFVGCAGEPMRSVAANLPDCDPHNAGLTLPDGFCALVVADELGRARHLDVSEAGDLYVRLREAADETGGIVALHDADDDGRAEIQERFGDHYGTGLELRGDYLYVSTVGSILRYPLTEGQLAPDGPPETIVEGFPEQRSHSAKGFTFDDSGSIYVNVGAPSNVCQEQSRTAGSLGQQPCPQLERQAGVWRFNAERPGQTQEQDGHHFVTGTRNIVGLAWDPNGTGLYAMQHGRDSLHTLWFEQHEHFTDEVSAEVPSEELLHLEDGANFGWPYCYHDPLQGHRMLAPEYGGDGKAIGDCGEYSEPVVAFPGHYAPDDLLFYTGDQFPERYRGGVFVAFHGSWNRAPLPQGGYQVAFVPFAGGKPTAEWETFANEFAGVSPVMGRGTAVHRPVGLAQGPDGSLYVSDDVGGRIWRIVYPGAPSSLTN